VIIMHTNILVLTFADDAHAAYRRASRSIEMIAKNSAGTIEYAPTDKYDESRVMQVSTPIFPADSIGREEVLDAFAKTKAAFMDNIKALRRILASNSDEELFYVKAKPDGITENDPMFFLSFCERLCMPRSSSIYLYDCDSFGITSDGYLKSVLNHTIGPNKPLWAVSFDVCLHG